jgi:metal-responsive CopG/Arc/MetJ family transcriptional regulator
MALVVHTMKTAISLEESLLEEADDLARKMHVSRSRLVSLALRDYLEHRRREDRLDRLNEVYGESSEAGEARLLPKMKAKFQRTIKDGW